MQREQIIEYVYKTSPNDNGEVSVTFKLNGQMRTVRVQDSSVDVESTKHRKAEKVTEVGSPLQGNLSKIYVKAGDTVKKNDPLFVIEAMKMESTISSPMAGVIEQVYLSEKTMVEQDDLVVEIDPERG